jgi:hypothetical protein
MVDMKQLGKIEEIPMDRVHSPQNGTGDKKSEKVERGGPKTWFLKLGDQNFTNLKIGD